jgi:hypothetical protein
MHRITLSALTGVALPARASTDASAKIVRLICSLLVEDERRGDRPRRTTSLVEAART